MIFWKSKEVPETREGFPSKAFRWVLDGKVSRKEKEAHFGFFYEWQHETGKWITTNVIYAVSLNSFWMWGSNHTYYDGPNCSFSIGPIHFTWSGHPMTSECRKCSPLG